MLYARCKHTWRSVSAATLCGQGVITGDFECLSCGVPVTIIRSTSAIPHFRHPKGDSCLMYGSEGVKITDMAKNQVNNRMSVFHKTWQSRFPESCLEKRFKGNYRGRDFCSRAAKGTVASPCAHMPCRWHLFEWRGKLCWRRSRAWEKTGSRDSDRNSTLSDRFIRFGVSYVHIRTRMLNGFLTALTSILSLRKRSSTIVSQLRWYCRILRRLCTTVSKISSSLTNAGCWKKGG